MSRLSNLKREGEIRIDAFDKRFKVNGQFVEIHTLRRGQEVAIKKRNVTRRFEVTHEMIEDKEGLFILVK
jgi:hypothetical protein